MRLTSSLIVITVLFWAAIGTNGLECYYSRINSCAHSHCNEANNIFNSSDSKTEAAIVGMRVEDWDSIPTCSSDNSEACSNNTQTCSNSSSSCGKLVFKIRTIANTNIHGEVVDVIGGAKESDESTIVIRGCLTPAFKCQDATGLKKEFNQSIPTSSNSSADGEVKFEVIKVTNEHTSCGRCETQNCNNNMAVLTEDVIHKPSQDHPNSVVKIVSSVLLIIGAGFINFL